MYCKFCGKEIDNDSTFCKFCGKNLGPAFNFINIEKTKAIKPDHEIASETKNTTRKVLKEILILVAFIGIAFSGKIISFSKENSINIPIVTMDEQKSFDDAIFKKKHPNGLPPLEEYLSNYGEYNESKYPTVNNFSYLNEAIHYLKFGDFKYDDEIVLFAQLERINEVRETLRSQHAYKISQITFWIILITTIVLRYAILSIKHLIKK